MTSELLVYVGFIVFTFVCGNATGATIVRDWLDGVGQRRQVRSSQPLPPPRYVFPGASIIWPTGWKKLEVPTIRRRK